MEEETLTGGFLLLYQFCLSPPICLLHSTARCTSGANPHWASLCHIKANHYSLSTVGKHGREEIQPTTSNKASQTPVYCGTLLIFLYLKFRHLCTFSAKFVPPYHPSSLSLYIHIDTLREIVQVTVTIYMHISKYVVIT